MHFDKIYKMGVVVRARCKYSAAIYNYHSKHHGTSSLGNHVLHYMKHLNHIEIRQSLLTLKPKSNVEVDDSKTLEILGTWKFD